MWPCPYLDANVPICKVKQMSLVTPCKGSASSEVLIIKHCKMELEWHVSYMVLLGVLQEALDTIRCSNQCSSLLVMTRTLP